MSRARTTRSTCRASSSRGGAYCSNAPHFDQAKPFSIATGPGTVARLAAEQVGPQGRVVEADVSEAMIAIARAKPPLSGAAKLAYVVSPAAPLMVEDGAFDVVTCQQGLQFVPDRAAAVREMRRALKPGGRVVAAVARDRAPTMLRRVGCGAAGVLAG